MPYDVKKRGKLWVIIRKRDGKVVGKSDSAKKAHISVWMRTKGER